LDQYCVTCHNERVHAGDLALDKMDVAHPEQRPEVWEKVVRKLRNGLMPPASVGPRRPDAKTRDGLLSYLETSLDRSPEATPVAGRTEAFHRLNRAEYLNAVRDLLSLNADVANLLPADDASYGFDNIAGVLKISQSRLEQYLSAAWKI